MKKIIVWILLICMKLTALSSCHTTKQPSTPSTDEIGGDMIQVEKDKLVIVRPETVSQTVSAELRALKSAFQALSGRNVEIVSEKEQTAAVHQSAGMTEILVGLTDRSASKSVYDALPNAGYSISYRDGAIVIGGTNDAMLIYAVRLFSKQCVAPCAGKDALTVSRELSLQNAPEDVIALIEEGRSCYSLAYSADVDYMPNADYANNGLDIEVGLLLQLQSKLQALTTEKIVNSSTEAEDSARREVLIGTDGRMEFATAKKQWAAHEYGVLVVGNKLVVSAWSDAGLQKAVAAFSSLIDLAVEEKDGKTTVRFIKDHLSVCSDGAWITDIPAYEGGTLSGANDAAYGQYLQLITQTNAEEYRAYCQVLERAGYTKYLSNQIGDNLFATYVKDNVKVHTYRGADAAVEKVIGAANVITKTDGLVGIQQSAIDENKFNIRFVAKVADTVDKAAVGFKLTAYNVSQTQDSTTVYTSINAIGSDGRLASVSASDLGGAGLYAVTLQGVPADITITITVQTYTKATQMDSPAVVDTYDLTFTNGVLTSCEAPTATA